MIRSDNVNLTPEQPWSLPQAFFLSGCCFSFARCKKQFYLLHCGIVILAAYYIETHYFRVTPFAPKTLLLFLVYQFISINLVTFLAYWVDKRAAVRGAWRISERNLHALEMLGGWSGALAGQKILHHKNKKKSYRAEFAFVLIMQLGFIAVALHFLGLL